jgi:hypothetical protein
MSSKTVARDSSTLGCRSLLDLPLDLLLHVYEAYLQIDADQNETRPCCCFQKLCDQEETHPPCCSWPLEHVSRATRATFQRFLADRSWRLEIIGESGAVRTDLPCPRRWNLAPPSRLNIYFHGFYYLSALAQIWMTLATLCRRLHGVSSLRVLKIQIDAALPRLSEPLNVDLIELERAPLIIMILLQPFTILHNIPGACVDVSVGTARRPLLQDMHVVNDFLFSIREHLVGENCSLRHDPQDMMSLWQRLDDHREFWGLWKDPTASCSTIICGR